MPRFTISHHSGAKEGDHYDLLLEQGEVLKTWRFPNITFQTPQQVLALKDHRNLYLDYEGEISGGRGRTKIWDTGVYSVDEWKESRIRVALMGKRTRMRLLLERVPASSDAPESPWTAVDASAGIRKYAAALLRGTGLEDAPSEELEDLRTALSHEEQRILAMVDQYTRGGEVEWSLVETDPDLRKTLGSERARWRHPWLEAAKTHAEKIEELTSLLRKQRPAPPA